METANNPSRQNIPALNTARALLRELNVPAVACDTGLDVAHQVYQFTDDTELAAAALLAHVRNQGDVPTDAVIEQRFSADLSTLTRELRRLGELGLPSGWSAAQGLNTRQTETVRKMLLAVAADPRLIVARLAEQLARLQRARELPAGDQQRLAVETREIFAPLANRLGVWTLKWELEDLAFRTLEPAAYHRIASALAERRVDREEYIRRLCDQLQQSLRQAGIAAQVYGRPKHIYSIWRKMQRKHLAFEQIFDVRAVRIVVESVAECYAALGVVHDLWPFIAGEFDDYIAIPKGNNYRSIHTAVTGPQGQAVEVQIRTTDMHEQAELGIAAHWRYKEDGGRDVNYERKIEWARRLLDPLASDDGGSVFLESVRRGLFDDRIYTFTPRGEIVDLPRGATPLDFAYHVHTNLGHRCRGAKVNGRIATLHQPLANGEVVEIITGRTGGPSRDWLNAEEGFLVSPRSRAKVRGWFRQQDEIVAAQAATATRPAATQAPPDRAELEQLLVARRAPRRRGKRSAVDIEGVGDLPTTMARCCAPVPPELIAGYVTLGRGVTIHRASCPSLVRMRATKPERVLQVQWNLDTDSLMPVQIRVEAFDRRGLLRDVTDVLAAEQLSIDGVNSNTDPADRIATIVMRTAVRDVAQLTRVLKRLRGVPNVLRSVRAA